MRRKWGKRLKLWGHPRSGLQETQILEGAAQFKIFKTARVQKDYIYIHIYIERERKREFVDPN